MNKCITIIHHSNKNIWPKIQKKIPFFERNNFWLEENQNFCCETVKLTEFYFPFFCFSLAQLLRGKIISVRYHVFNKISFVVKLTESVFVSSTSIFVFFFPSFREYSNFVAYLPEFCLVLHLFISPVLIFRTIFYFFIFHSKKYSRLPEAEESFLFLFKPNYETVMKTNRRNSCFLLAGTFVWYNRCSYGVELR